MSKEKMVYVMNVDWNWIKQRPQFLAEQLSDKYDLQVLYRYKYNRSELTKDETTPLFKLTRIFTIPFINKLPFFARFNNILFLLVVRFVVNLTRPAILYLTNPEQVDAIPRNYKGTVIYDCMDYHKAFINDKIRYNRLEIKEKELLEQSNIVLFTSEDLRLKILRDYPLDYVDKTIEVVRNGYDGEVLEENEILLHSRNREALKITYIGTVSYWFDFDIIRKIIEEFDFVTFDIIGPTSHITLPEIDRVNFVGSVPHSELVSYMKDTDVLIMPFVVNEIVEAVDPVKLYEYINFNRDFLSVYYPEIDRFKEFAYLYSNFDDVKQAIQVIRNSKELKYSREMRQKFLESNKWSNRANQIIKVIEKRG